MEAPTNTPSNLSNPRIRPFKISIPDSQITALHQKLELASFPDELELDKFQEWDMGAPLEDIKRLTAHWKGPFDWRKAEQDLNDILPQYMTTVSVEGGFGMLMYILCISGVGFEKGERLFRYCFCMGPGSFIELKKVLPLLTQGDDDQPTFDVVAPSLPNFGFSPGISKSSKAAIGAPSIARTMAIRYPKTIKALHLNFIPSPPPYPWRNPLLFLQGLLGFIIPPFSASNRQKIAITQTYLERENAYARQQDTYPQTLGYALNDSPVGLLAWIYDKLHRWTEGYPWTDEEVLQWVSIYAFSKAGPAASLRIYHESVTKPDLTAYEEGVTWLSRDQVVSTRIPSCVKIAVASFPGEIM
ncbi:epoxide hydrolase, putative [Talaromyces stipitatus ATCC 10500]|uniref:Epoxide hydrolase, putative n=1 Tax=Talaromyces stipitatus (strain ATCC 10500 / CBS 375.48 / QM 6759 / NRRL 1006) TaxID=441959 RepID=B8MKC3_TALSN|nr:epoxide hydrolase, putative [Talaromyces stipitatus ATCC 10500]EED15278.1 epoxide hydrolase, putative [Talaromyces stipitatus ATCC 10500]